jgi:hypothetical protein
MDGHFIAAGAALWTVVLGWALTAKYPVHWHMCKCMIKLRAQDAWLKLRGPEAWMNARARSKPCADPDASAVTSCPMRTAESPQTFPDSDSDSDMNEPGTLE